MDREDMRVAARVMEAVRLLDAQQGTIRLLHCEGREASPGQQWILEQALVEEKRLKARLSNLLRTVRVTPDTPFGLAVLAAGERIERMGAQAWCDHARECGGPRIAAGRAFEFGQGILGPDAPESPRMLKALIAQGDACACPARLAKPTSGSRRHSAGTSSAKGT